MIAKLAEFARLVSMKPLGPIVEVGVYRGDSAYYLMQVAKDRGSELHLFDTFARIPHRIEMDNHQVEDFGDVSLVTGGIMVFDDYTDTKGCVKAVDETFPHLYLTVSGKAYVVKP